MSHCDEFANENEYDITSQSDGYIKWNNIHVYVSGEIGSTIRDAETGEMLHGFIVGKDDNWLFKVSFKSNGLTAFYQTPAHYTNHMHKKIGLDSECKWNSKWIRHMNKID